MPYIIDFCSLTQIRKPSGPIRSIRRIQEAPYPLTKLQSALNQPPQPSLGLNSNHNSIRAQSNNSRHSIKPNYLQQQQIHSTSVPKLNSFNDNSSNTGSTKSAPALRYAPHDLSPINQNVKKSSKFSKSKNNINSTTEPTTPTNLARQILNNLNIFSHHSTHEPKHDEPSTSSNKKGFTMHQNNSHKQSKSKSLSMNSHGSRSMLDIDSQSMNSRRESVDTISTYLSSGSKGSVHKPSYGSVSDLLNCSLGSENDEVFLSSRSSLSSTMSMNMIIKGSIVGIDPNSDQISKFVCVVDPPQNVVKPCPICLDELHRENSSKNPTVSLSRCQHLMHLNCLNELILSQKSEIQKVLNHKLIHYFIQLINSMLFLFAEFVH